MTGMQTARIVEEAAHTATVARFFGDVLRDGHHDRLDMIATDYVPRLPALRGLPALAPGRDALGQRLRQAGRLNPRVYRMVADGDFVFAHVCYEGATWVAGADIFRFDGDGRIAEHWNSRQAIADGAGGGIERFAGGGNAEAPMSAERRADIRRITLELLDIWRNGDAALVSRYYDDGYIQHNPDMPGGAARIRTIFETNIKAYIAATGGPFPVDCHMIGVQGDLVFVNYSVFMAGINRNEGARSTNTDVFRIDANDRMAEHWDVLQIETDPLPDPRTFF